MDSKDNEFVEVSLTAAVMKTYRKTVDAFCAGMKDVCTRHAFSYIFTTTAMAFDQLVLNYLRKARMLG